jgi:dipeptidase D
MSVLANLQPKRVFEIFEQIAAIPHGSGNTSALGDWCVQQIQSMGVCVKKDKVGNVIACKAGSEGREQEPPVILQAHLDMVCEKLPEMEFDFLKDSLVLATDGKTVWAEGTTLGADNGIGLAMILAILEDTTLSHPPVEAVLTIDEETGLEGAAELDFADLKGRRMINLDSEDEGVFTAGCAGGVRVDIAFDLNLVDNEKPSYTITLGGLPGGHSGIDINKGRHNANYALAKLVKELSDLGDVQMVSMNGGALENVICRQSACVLVTDISKEMLVEKASAFESRLKDQNNGEVFVTVEDAPAPDYVWDNQTTNAVLELLTTAPNGVQAMCKDLPDLVETSLNLGVIRTEGNTLTVSYSLRSSVQVEKENLLHRLTALAQQFGATARSSGDYPGWEYRADSALRTCMVETYEKLYGKSPVVEVIHAGLECGLFCEKCGDLDAISMGPDMKNVHSTDEWVDVASVGRVYEYLTRVLEQL